LLDPLVDRRNELARDHPADDVVHELIAVPAGRGLDPNPTVTELPASARLLFVATLSLRRRGECLAVGDAWLRELRADAVFPFQSGHRHGQTARAHARDHGLVRPRPV